MLVLKKDTMVLTEKQQFLDMDIATKKQEITNSINKINNIRRIIEKRREQLKELKIKRRG